MDSENLEQYREKLLSKQAELINIVQKTENYGREADSENEAMDLADKASSSYTKEFMFSKSHSDRQFLVMVNDALLRIKNGGFGECINCEERIGEKRLEAVPWARLCIACQEMAEDGLLQG